MNEATGYMTEERLAFREQARDFTDKEVLPVANRLDPQKGDIPRELIDKMGRPQNIMTAQAPQSPVSKPTSGSGETRT